jgi:hypothetical protein
MREYEAQKPPASETVQRAAWEQSPSGFILLPEAESGPSDPHDVVLFPAGWADRYKKIAVEEEPTYAGYSRQQVPFYCAGAAYVCSGPHLPPSPGVLSWPWFCVFCREGRFVKSLRVFVYLCICVFCVLACLRACASVPPPHPSELFFGRRADVLRAIIQWCAPVGVTPAYLCLHGSPKCGKTALAVFAAFYASQRKKTHHAFLSGALVLQFDADIRKKAAVAGGAKWANIVCDRLVEAFPKGRRKDVLVVLDGCDFSTEEEPHELLAMLDAVSGKHSDVRFLATSRGELGE